MIDVDTSSFFAIVLVAAIAAITVVDRAEALRAAGRRARALPRNPDRTAGPRPRPLRQLHRILLQPRARDALLLRRLRDRLRTDQGQADGARRARAGRSRWRSPSASAASSPERASSSRSSTPAAAMATTAIGTLIPILRDNGELKSRFGTYLLAAGGRRGVRPDPARDAGPLDRQPAARVRDPARLRRPGADRGDRLGALRLAGLAGAGKDLRGEQPARGAGHRRPRLRPGAPCQPARARRAARRLRRRDDHPCRPARA